MPGVGLAFDHHASEAIRVEDSPENHIIVPGALSAARVVYDHYGGAERFPTISEEMMAAVDKADSAQFSESEILDPQGWILMSFLMDPRTGLGRFREFRISNYQLMMQLIDDCTQMTVEEILQTPDVAERVALYNEHSERAVEQIRRCSKVDGNLVVLDLRDEEVIHPTNRFMIYALYPDTNISIHVLWGLKQQNTVFATGKSIINRSSQTNVGELMLAYGGGGHDAAGTCQVDNEDACRDPRRARGDDHRRRLIVSPPVAAARGPRSRGAAASREPAGEPRTARPSAIACARSTSRSPPTSAI